MEFDDFPADKKNRENTLELEFLRVTMRRVSWKRTPHSHAQGGAMKTTLKLSERLLALGREQMGRGQSQEAQQLLGKLATFGDLSPQIAEDTQSELADICFKQRRFKKA